MAFPVAPGDGDEYTNALGTIYKYLLADDKWYIINQSYLENIVEDSTPQLGGDLDLNGKNIDFPTTPNISDCLDEDNMASDSATMLATQQSIKAYVYNIIQKTIDPYHTLGYNGFVENTGYSGPVYTVAMTDASARIKAGFYITNGGSFKLVMTARRTGGNVVVDGAVYGGEKPGDGSADSGINLWNAENFDFTLTNLNGVYTLKSTAVTISDNQTISIAYYKTANEVAGTFAIYGMWLERQ